MTKQTENSAQDHAVCRLCGTAIPLPLDKRGETENERMEYATMHCDCPDARNYQQKVKEEKRRTETLERAARQIEQLFGTGAREFGFAPVEKEVRIFLVNTAAHVYDHLIKNVTVNLPGGAKAQVGITAKDVITVLRQQTETFKREV